MRLPPRGCSPHGPRLLHPPPKVLRPQEARTDPISAASNAIYSPGAATKSRNGTLSTGGCIPSSPRCPESATSDATCSLGAARGCTNGTLGARERTPSSPKCLGSAAIGATCSTAAAKECTHGTMGAGGCIPASPMCPKSATDGRAEAPRVPRDIVPPHGTHLGYGHVDSLRGGGQVGPWAPEGHVHCAPHNVRAICSPLASPESSCAPPRSVLHCRIVGVHEVGPQLRAGSACGARVLGDASPPAPGVPQVPHWLPEKPAVSAAATLAALRRKAAAARRLAAARGRQHRRCRRCGRHRGGQGGPAGGPSVV